MSRSISIRPAPDYAPAIDWDPHQIAPSGGGWSASAERAEPYLPRSKWLPVPFLLPVALSGLSWLFGGVAILNDLSFVSLTVLCLITLFLELVRFPRRFGLGGVVLFLGILVWYCHDYLYNWLGHSVIGAPDRSFFQFWGLQPVLIAKAAFLASLCFLMMTIGLLQTRLTQLPAHFAGAVPEPQTGVVYLFIIVMLFAIGVAPFFLFARVPWYEAIYMHILGGRTAAGSPWGVGRAQMNTSWEGFMTQMLDAGQLAGMLAGVYALMRAQLRLTKWACWGIWAFAIAVAFGTGTRGMIAFTAAPVVGVLFIKFQSITSEYNRGHSKRGYLMAAGILTALLVIIQIQGVFRDKGFAEAEVSEIDWARPRGNMMFSEALPALRAIPDERPFFRNSFTGEGFVRPLPDMVVGFFITPIPRVLWPGKPVSESWLWMNKLILGHETRSGNIASGISISSYIEYGIGGVMWFGFILGWFLRVSERVLQDANGRPMQFMISLAVAAWMFRSFRGLGFNDMYVPLLGILIFSTLCLLLGSQSRSSTNTE